MPTPSNAGLGWTLSLGDLRREGGFWIYRGPDGGEHTFYETLHEEDDDDNAETFYTRDSSYLRLKLIVQTGNRLVEFPDGTNHEFEEVPGTIVRRLVQIRDRYEGNFLTLDYPTDDHWVLTDSHDRVHEVFLDEEGNVETVDLAAFGGQRAIYSFSYADALIDYSCKDFHPFHEGEQAEVSFLTSVTLPDGSSFEMLDGGSPAYETTSDCDVADTSGILTSLTLATGGRYEWIWQYYPLPKPAGLGWIEKSTGVATRTHRNLDGSVAGVWTYAPELIRDALDKPDATRTTVFSPDGEDCSRHYFNALPNLAEDNISWGYGLPFHPSISIDVGFGEWDHILYLSSEVFESADCSGSPVRSTFVRYWRDTLPPLPPPTEPRDNTIWYNTNRRLKWTRTIFHDDADAFRETEWRVFDGLGHYRNRYDDGSFLSGPYDDRFTYHDYNHDRGTYEDVYWNWNMLPDGAPWVLHTQRSWYTPGYHAGNTSGDQFCFDDEGFLTRRRRMANGLSPLAHDILELYTRDDAGQLVKEEYYGGDLQELPADVGVHVCAIDVEGLAAQYEIVHDYDSGVRKRTYYLGADGNPMGFSVLDRSIDPDTGLVASSKDVAGVETGYSYDPLGRLKAVTPAPLHDARTVITYTPAGEGSGAVINTRRFENGGVLLLAESAMEFDSFGRLAVEARRQPGDTIAFRRTEYNARGWRTALSEWSSDGGPKTLFLDFDAFGRPRTIRPPDGASHDVGLAYEGAREVSRTVRVAMGSSMESASTTIERYDALGRLHAVLEPSGEGGALTTTTYEHDAMDHIYQVKTGVQAGRVFEYDNLGLLRKDNGPEMWSGQERRYGDYDARGNPGFAEGVGISPLKAGVRFVRDRAERVTEVWELKNADGHVPTVVKQFVYGQANDGADLRLGKLWGAVRYNPSGPKVTEIYTYAGLGGRVSKRRTEINDVARFEQLFSWTQLGDPAALRYPSCLGCSSGAPVRDVTYEYDLGFLNAIPGYAPSISYHPAGLVNVVVHENNTADQWTLDPAGLGRPLRIRTQRSGGQELLKLGDYAYDGAGNVKAIGSDSFTYDAVSRVTGASVAGVGATYTYDEYGNLLPTHPDLAIGNPFGADNRLRARNPNAIVEYDYHANITRMKVKVAGEYSDSEYLYDAFDMITAEVKSGTTFAYTADDERIATTRATLDGPVTTWRIRDLNGKVLRQFWEAHVTGEWEWGKDYIYRAGLLLASQRPQEGLFHFHLDHLGTPRLVTQPGGSVASRHDYLPFGEEVTAPTTEVMKFTGHERDYGGMGDFSHLDYMHARYYATTLGRFLSLDPVNGNPRAPQSWNRYAYVTGNPLKYVDPTGEIFILSACAGGSQAACAQQAMLLYNALGRRASQYIGLNTQTGVVSLKGISGRAFGERFGDFAGGVGRLIGSKDSFSLVTDSGRASDSGGGLFDPGRRGGGTIFIETQMFPRQTGDVTGTAQTALVHETGHAMRALFPSFFDETNSQFVGGSFPLALRGEGYAVNFENRYRQDRGLAIRYTYDPSLADVLVDFGVDLFPGD